MDKHQKGIGSLNEHTLHLALKNYIEPETSFHECECEGFVVDVKRGQNIFEIETRSFSNERKKLKKLLLNNTVTIVYPIAEKKWVIWVDEKSGEVSKRHKSPKKGRASDVCYELYKIKSFINNKNFRLKLVMAEIVEYKRLDGWGNGGKRGATRIERIPEKIYRTIDFSSPKDYSKLAEVIPDGKFTAKELSSLNKIKPRYTWYLIDILMEAGIIERCGKEGRAYIYKKSDELF